MLRPFGGFIKPVKAYTSVMQYINCLVDTINLTCDYKSDHEIDKWNEDMVGLQRYLFGIDPVHDYDSDVYIDTMQMEDLIRDEFKSFMCTMNTLCYAYNGYQLANILYDVSLRKGVVGRACYNIKCFIKSYPDKIEWKSLNDLMHMSQEDAEQYEYRYSMYIRDFWMELDDALTREVRKMNEINRKWSSRSATAVTPMNITDEDMGVCLYVYRND
mgnify:CR=1 FL=1